LIYSKADRHRRLRFLLPVHIAAIRKRSMPTPSQLAAIDQQLAGRALQLKREVSAARARGEAEGIDGVADRKDEADERMRAEMLDREIERDLAELREIDLARERIARSLYGRCVDCGSRIPVQRLLIQPQASRCTACQAKAERTAGHALS
jgi:DnaK suppressor protein